MLIILDALSVLVTFVGIPL